LNENKSGWSGTAPEADVFPSTSDYLFFQSKLADIATAAVMQRSRQKFKARRCSATEGSNITWKGIV